MKSMYKYGQLNEHISQDNFQPIPVKVFKFNQLNQLDKSFNKRLCQ